MDGREGAKMITILSANENLLERLVLLVQNDAVAGLADDSSATNRQPAPPAVRAFPLLLDPSTTGLPLELPSAGINNGQLLPEGPLAIPICTDWIFLMAKKEFTGHLVTINVLADLLRLSMASGEQKNRMRILIVKKEHSEGDDRSLREHIETVGREWHDEWSNQMDKLRRFGESDARREHIERAAHWQTWDVGHDIQQQLQQGEDNPASPLPHCSIAYFDDPDLMAVINTFFHLGDRRLELMDPASDGEEQLVRRNNLFTKPPALHWTNFPRDAEVQVSFRFSFPKGTITNGLFHEWARTARRLGIWDYEYQWTNGILLRAEELIKVTITRAANEPNVVEVSGRIDTDEAAEGEAEDSGEAIKNNERGADEEEGNGMDKFNGGGDAPQQSQRSYLNRVWPYLVRVLRVVLGDIEQRRKSLPFNLAFVFIGTMFFDCSDCENAESVQKLSARSLDAIQTLSSIQRVQAVRFKADQQIYSLKLNQCFPGFWPTKLADYNEERFPLPMERKSSRSNRSKGNNANANANNMNVDVLLGGGEENSHGALSTTSSSSSAAEVTTAATSLVGSVIHSGVQSPRTTVVPAAAAELLAKVPLDRSPSCVPAFGRPQPMASNGEAASEGYSNVRPGNMNNTTTFSCSNSTSPVPQAHSPSHSLHVDRYKNRGRRVSFGLIQSIPNSPAVGDGPASATSTPAYSPSPLLARRQQSKERKEEEEEYKDGEEKGKNNNSPIALETIVDELLQKAIDEVVLVPMAE